MQVSGAIDPDPRAVGPETNTLFPNQATCCDASGTSFWPCSGGVPGHVSSLAYESNVVAFNPLKWHSTRWKWQHTSFGETPTVPH
jgi:hypothetical protein